MGYCNSLLAPALIAAVLAACAAEADSRPTATPTPQPNLEREMPSPHIASTIAPETPEDVISELSPSQIAPLTLQAVASCPVTLPNGRSPEGARRDSDFNLGNDNGTLFTIPWPGGKVLFTPNGAGQQNADGSLGMKWPWYRTHPGDVFIAGRRLDAVAPPMHPVVLRGSEDGYGETGFQPSGLLFPTEGCWEVAATQEEESLSFVTLVVRLDFDPPRFQWSPDRQLTYSDVDLTGLPNSIREILTSPAGGWMSLESGPSAPARPVPLVQYTIETVDVNETKGKCVTGESFGRDGQIADATTLQWKIDQLHYRIVQVGLRLSCEELIRMAES